MYSSERPRIVRGPLRAFSCAPSPRLTGPRLGGILPQKQSLARLALSANLQGAWTPGSAQSMDGRIRGDRRRSRCWASQLRPELPEGARRWIAALAKQYTDVLSEPPGRGEKRRAVRFARCESDHRVRCL